METKLSAALCALLVLSLGSADHDAGSTVSPSKLGNESDPSGDVVPGPVPDLDENNSSDTSPALNHSSDLATGNQTFPIKAQEENTTDVSAATPVSHKNESSTSRPSSPPTAAPSEGRSSASLATSVTAALTTLSSNGSTASNWSDAVRPGSLATAATQTEAPSSTSTQTPEQQRPETPPTTTTLSGSAPAHGPTVSLPSTSGPQSSRIPLTSTEARLKTTTSTSTSTTSISASPLNTSIQARTHAGSPSQLNMGGDSHGPPTLDPLLAGLVSAFILTAVVITLLLFLKLRRRNDRPEFRRLQDLPMDDMMEDTPLSMYSY